MCIPAHVCSIALGGCKTASDPWELELKLMVRGLMWVLETEFWSFGRAAMILKLSCQAPIYLSFKIFLLGSVFGNVGFVYIILALFCFVLQMYLQVLLWNSLLLSSDPFICGFCSSFQFFHFLFCRFVITYFSLNYIDLLFTHVLKHILGNLFVNNTVLILILFLDLIHFFPLFFSWMPNEIFLLFFDYLWQNFSPSSNLSVDCRYW